MNQSTEKLCAFLDRAHSVYHAQAGIRKELEAAGYIRLAEKESRDLIPGGKYYVSRGGTSLVAFRMPTGKPTGFMMSASHCDRPSFKLKQNFELASAYTRLGVEGYGGMLVAPWLDRPLSIAGRVTVETEKGIETKLVDIDKDLLIIPNVAIHLNRGVNDGYKWNPAVDTLPLVGTKEVAGKLEKLLEQEAGGKILGHDLYLYVREKAKVWGMDDEFISAQGLDDLECVWACTQGFLNAELSSAIPVLCVFDNEEVGSASAQGADSSLLLDVLERICADDDVMVHPKRTLAQSFMVSADNAHALHPNHPELSDPNNTPIMGGGVVVKYNANLSYCTDGVSAGVFRKICDKAGVPLQTYSNRADIRGGGTLGRVSLTQVSVPTVDIGLPQLAMHSCYETAAVADAIALEKAMKAFYSTSLIVTDEGYIID